MTIKHLIKDIWLNTKGQYMKESNTLAVIVTIKQPRPKNSTWMSQIPLRQMWISGNYKGKSGWTPKGSTWRSQIPLRKIRISSNYQYHCGRCEYKATHKGHLTQHQRAVHEEEKYPSAKCDYQGTTKGNLGKHQRAVHERVKYPLRQMWIQSNYEEKSDWSPKGSSWRSQKPLR